jgi:hypothetical protein
MLKRAVINFRRLVSVARHLLSGKLSATALSVLFRDFFGSLRPDQLSVLLEMLDTPQKLLLMDLLRAVEPIEPPPPDSVTIVEELPFTEVS